MLLFVSFVSVSFFIIFYRHRSPFSVPNLPPGKAGFPVIGESLEFLSAGRKGLPEKFFSDRMTEYSSKVFKTSILGEPTVIFCGAACNKFLFSNENKHVISWWPENVKKLFPTNIQTNSKEEAKKLRNILPQFLSAKAIQRYVGIMDTVAQRHFALEWENNTQVTVLPLAKRYTFGVASRVFMSIDDLNQVAKLAEPLNQVNAGIISMPINFPGTVFNRGIKASKFIRRELLRIVKQRKVELANGMSTPTQDILSHMLIYCDENGQYLAEHDIVNKILGLLIGSHETTSTVCTFVVKYLAELPQNIYENVYQEQMAIAKSKAPGELLNWDDIQKMKYSWNVACEVIRLNPPAQGAFREAINDFIFDGFSIPKGWKLYWSANSTHKNPEYFPEPEKFDPSRFEGTGPAPYTYVPFGGGPSMCPGKEYARMELLVFMHNLVKRFKCETLFPNGNVTYNPTPIPAKGLPVRLIPHRS